MTLIKLILLPSLLLTSSLINGEAISDDAREYFATTLCAPVKTTPLRSPFLPKPLSAANDAYDALQKEIGDIKAHLYNHEATSGTKTPEYYRLLARLSEIYVETIPSAAGYHSQNKLYYLSLAKEAEQCTPHAQQQQAWDDEEKAYVYDSAEWHEFKARVAGVMAEWYGKDTPDYVICKNNQSIYTQNAKCIRLKKAWDDEEKTYVKESAEWYDFIGRVEGAKAEWYGKDTPEYTSCKNAQSICIENAKFIRQQKMCQEKQLEWQEEAKKYNEGSPEAYEFLARTEGEQATWYASNTAEYAHHKEQQEYYVQEAATAKRKKEEAEQQRQQRISVGYSQRQNPNYRSIELIVRSVFEHATLLDIASTLTHDDLSEIMFYIPQDLKDNLYGRLTDRFSISFTANAVNRARARDWSAFSEIKVDFRLVELMPYETEPQSTQHIFASSEIEQFIESNLKHALKSLLDGKRDDLIDQNWSTIYKNFSPDDLNRVRRDLTEKGISAATLDLSTPYDEEAIGIALYNGLWDCMYGVDVSLKFIDFAAVLEEWNKLYKPNYANPGLGDPDPKRPLSLNPKEHFASSEFNAITMITKELKLPYSEALLIKVAEVIFTKERARAIVDKILNPFEETYEADTDEDE